MGNFVLPLTIKARAFLSPVTTKMLFLLLLTTKVAAFFSPTDSVALFTPADSGAHFLHTNLWLWDIFFSHWPQMLWHFRPLCLLTLEHSYCYCWGNFILICMWCVRTMGVTGRGSFYLSTLNNSNGRDQCVSIRLFNIFLFLIFQLSCASHDTHSRAVHFSPSP